MEHIQQSCMHVPQASGQSLHAESSELARKSSGNRAVFQAFVTPPGLILWQRLKPPRPTPLREYGTLQAIQALRSVVMQLAPHTASSREPARRAETNVHLHAGAGARGCVPRLPVRRESIKVARIESPVKNRSMIECIPAAASRFASRDLCEFSDHDVPPDSEHSTMKAGHWMSLS